MPFINSNTAITVTSGTTINGAQTVNTGTSLVAVCYVTYRDSFGGSASVATITLGGTAMTAIAAALDGASGYKLRAYQLTTSAGLTTGTPTLAISFTTANGALSAASAVVIVYSSVDQSTPIRPASSTSFNGISDASAQASVAIPSVATDTTMCGSMSLGGTPGTNQTQRFNDLTAAYYVLIDEATGAAPTVTHTHNIVFTGTPISMQGFSVQTPSALSSTPTVGAATLSSVAANRVLGVVVRPPTP